MLPHWKHFDLAQRCEIANGLSHGESLRAIAERIGMDPTSVSKEIKRNRTKEDAKGLNESAPISFRECQCPTKL
ncbi:MAG: helix-turn-helix domain-containing protein [Bacilli bacterium]|nr:helix-turn-helix domain-containing protein [Bacilli bacterium]